MKKAQYPQPTSSWNRVRAGYIYINSVKIYTTQAERSNFFKTSVKQMHSRDMSLNNKLSKHQYIEFIDMLQSASDTEEEFIKTEEYANVVDELLDSYKSLLSKNKLRGKNPVVAEKIINERLLSDDPKPLHMLGKEFGITRESIRLVEQKLLNEMKLRLAS